MTDRTTNRLYRLPTHRWHILRINFLMAGTFALAATVLAWLVHPAWVLLAGFVGVMQVMFALTGWCPSAMLLSYLGVAQTETCALNGTRDSASNLASEKAA